MICGVHKYAHPLIAGSVRIDRATALAGAFNLHTIYSSGDGVICVTSLYD